MESITIEAALFKYEGPAAWYFIAADKKRSKVILSHQRKTSGWRSVPVKVTIGKSTWNTSFFPTKGGIYLLPIKAGIRKAEELEEGIRVKARCLFV